MLDLNLDRLFLVITIIIHSLTHTNGWRETQALQSCWSVDQLFEMLKVSNTQSMQTTADYVYDMSENANIEPNLFIYFTIQPLKFNRKI